jgi:hypothetical protein
MELSHEDRQRIYLEEKARFEAQEKLRAAATPRKRAGCWFPAILSFLAALAIVLIANLTESPRKT